MSSLGVKIPSFHQPLPKELEEMKRQRLARGLAQTKAPDVTETPATVAPEEVKPVVEIEEDGCDGFYLWGMLRYNH